MTITVRWDDPEQTITYMCFSGALHINRVFDAWREELAMQTSVDHPVYSLNDMSATQPVLRGINLRHLVAFVQQHQAPNLRMTIQYAPNPIVRRGLKTIAAFMTHEVHIVATLDEAYTIIHADKATRQEKRAS